jgi:acyl transferase domain-containing protein
MVVAAPTTSPRLEANPSRDGWDSRAIVIRGDNRAQLRDRVAELIDSIERIPAIVLADLAATLVADLSAGGARLGVVASSSTDLLVKLRQASDRLADPKCRQIRDSAGLYYFESPLSTSGTLALLFPGEGAQYTGMLADLCPIFLETEETFAWCDQLAAVSGQPSLREVLHPAPNRRADAEAELRKLGPSIFGVLVADLALTRVLKNLRIPISAVAGHSAGELAALLASGAMDSEAVLGPRLAEIMEIMQRQEDEAGGPDITLLAIGAGRAVVEEVAALESGRSVIVAMDNCPHQCVAVGPSTSVNAVESSLLSRGLICERLPFRRPYHTPLFEPWMRPFRELFAEVPFAFPHTPVYCCSTGALFPSDPDDIRVLAVNHWVKPVEFARMIESMYSDGVRLFVEAGPRGNLSAFVEDILRGKPFAAIPANVQRRSGPSQINHLVAQLAAHHVPLELGHLFTEVKRTRTDSTHKSADRDATVIPPIVLQRPDARQSSELIQGYLEVMEQFLDLQREVMDAFLAGRAAPPELQCALPDSPSLLKVEEPSRPFALIGRVEKVRAWTLGGVSPLDGRARGPLRRRPHTRRTRRQSSGPRPKWTTRLADDLQHRGDGRGRRTSRPRQGGRRDSKCSPLPLVAVRPRPNNA